MLSLQAATEIAQQELQVIGETTPNGLQFKKVERSGSGWLFYYTTEELLAGRSAPLLAGNLPI